MARKTVAQQMRRVGKLKSTAFENAGEGGAGLDRLTSPFLEPEEQPPDWVLVILLIGRLLVNRLNKVLRLDKAHFDNVLTRRGLQEERDQGTKNLRATLIDLRQATEAIFGKTKSAELIATDGNTPEVADTLVDQAVHALAKLRNPDLELPKRKVRGFGSLNPQEWIDDIESVMDKLVVVRDELETKRRHFERSVGRKEKAFEDLDFAISHGTAVVRGLFHLAGLSDIANRLAIRRRSQSGLEPGDELPEGKPPEDEEAPPAAETAAPADSESADATES